MAAAARSAAAMASARCGEPARSAAAAASRSSASLIESADCAEAGAAAHAAAGAKVNVRLFIVIFLRALCCWGRAARDGVLLARAHLRGHHPDLEQELLRVDAAPH